MSDPRPWAAGYPDPDAEADVLVQQALHNKPRPIEWARLTTSEEADQLDDLRTWVRWLVLRYRLDQREVPPCWAQHGELVEELAALRTARHGAYAPGGPLTGPADWHQTLAATRHRLGLWISRTGCRLDHHRAAATPSWATQPTAFNLPNI
jgi:hypothetical protein